MQWHDLNSSRPVYDAKFHKYFYTYYTSNGDGIYHASWDFHALKADDYSFHSVGFAIDISNLGMFGDIVTQPAVGL